MIFEYSDGFCIVCILRLSGIEAIVHKDRMLQIYYHSQMKYRAAGGIFIQDVFLTKNNLVLIVKL